MRDETLLDKAIQNYNFAVSSWHSIPEDEAYLNFIGYFLQQTVELAMKYVLAENGVSYYKTHDIEQLLYIGHKYQVNMHASEYIEEHAEMFTSWEAKTRYVLNYRIEYKKVERALGEVGQYLEALKKAESEKMDLKGDSEDAAARKPKSR